MARYLYSELAMLIQARRNCAESVNGTPSLQDWFEKHSDRIEALVREHMPSGSGFDSGTTLDLDASHAERLVFNTAFHHMEDGYYAGWTQHTVTVTPSFHGFNLRVSGRNRNDIKDYIGSMFHEALHTELSV